MTRPSFKDFKNDIIVYKSNDYGYVLKLWCGCIKAFYFSDFNKEDYIDDKYQVFQWLLECASKLTYPSQAKNLAKYAIENWCVWERD